MESIKCSNSCCHLKQWQCYFDKNKIRKYGKRNKAGIIIISMSQNMETQVLLVRSRGYMWGFPKGGMHENETITECAMREVKEETGLDVFVDFKTPHFKINNCVYFFIHIPFVNEFTIISDKDNDASGIGWMKPKCLINSEDIPVTSYCKIVMSRWAK